MDEQQELKQELQQIKNNNYAVPEDVDAYPYAQWMLDSIGSPDADLRDDLIYSTIERWITGEVFRQKELRGLLLQTLSPDYLFYKIGEKGTDSVFKRAFSILIPPLILSVHEKEPFLSEEQLYSVAEQVFEYVYLEQDVRGYVEGKGWAHSTAHAADALNALARTIRNREFSHAILAAVRHKVRLHDYVYINFEDERLVTAVMSVWNQNILTEEEWNKWLHTFTIIEEASVSQNDILVQNIRSFLRSLYFRALEQEGNSSFTIAIRETLKKWHRF
ncbi:MULTISPECIES: DUF2785 domain-containing protein [Bacillus cereus group]|uniref:DUF2785 domain-containing protein n=2 Tax=Bacillus cereus TaxID=1396 RepID=A0AA44Q6F3_BACCE|nr:MULTISPECIES: DUF2785 domain-containing protein [Bacillus cereus group]PFA17813.1 hypothetical protein CN373_20150 [Bacillus cereus]PFN07297.1 hypothetical protein COJ55_11160 [Bacillus cereus]PFO83369.1 hypothetical protein COJ77_08910 [Bacillus cereus]PFR22832.1 hypothetical protein COK19_21165 [Bacillus cereus]PFR90283.1 hypothetical protein COK38_23460 [Bacillus cereus]